MKPSRMRCPKCRADGTVHQVASHNYPVSSAWPAIFGLWSWLFLVLLPARFSCRACHATFRRYTAGRALVLALVALLIVMTFAAAFAGD